MGCSIEDIEVFFIAHFALAAQNSPSKALRKVDESLTFEQRPKPWLFVVYMGLYYPVMWGL